MPNQYTYMPMRAAGRRYAEAGGRFPLAEANRRWPDNDNALDAFVEGADGAAELANGTTLDQRIDAHEQGYQYAENGGRDYGHESHRLFSSIHAPSDYELRTHFRRGYHDWHEAKRKERRVADARRKREREALAREQGAQDYHEGATRDTIGQGLKVGGRLHRLIDWGYRQACREDGKSPGVGYNQFWIHAFA